MSLNLRSSSGSEAGFSLIQVLVSLALLSLCVGLFFQARSTSFKARKSADSAATITDVNDAFVSELSAIIRDVDASTPGCLDYVGQITDRRLAKSSDASTITHSTNVVQPQFIAAGLDSKSRDSLQSQFGQEPLRSAIKRCMSPRQPANASQPNANIFYLCMNMKQDDAAPAGSFLNAPFAFAEVGWQLVNLQTGANMSCTDFASADKSAGARVYYSIYWAVPMSGTVTIKKHINTFTMGK
ncbi:hypothetical protein [Oligoflexus tunisiensis]|uniref:hypothetical protein n=1 Tax=Oligoflexus tunisiensis TaxID=708132 RepID=UPI00114C88A8|nr:hypothetical protein [Oligoflexus tunisiensis]